MGVSGDCGGPFSGFGRWTLDVGRCSEIVTSKKAPNPPPAFSIGTSSSPRHDNTQVPQPASQLRRAIYPGSFDPVTRGHLDVLARAAGLFDEVVVAVAHNDQKHALFSSGERVRLLQDAVADLPNVKVASFAGLLVDFAKAHGAIALVRGLRAVSDFEFEFQMGLMNRRLAPELETVFLMPREEYTFVSSRIVKEIARLGGAIEAFVPPGVVHALHQRFQKI